ncbi:MAG: hypothetical protein IKO72_14435 [Kiritimatiellae bacterium]|nr:hypothetical protein [Kiritimatiellia bacterium]
MQAREVIGRLNAREIGKEITYHDGGCVHLGCFWGEFGPRKSLHYEIEAYYNCIRVEIHSEMVESLQAVHAFLYEQFKEKNLGLKGRVREGNLVVNRAYRFATTQIACDRSFDAILKEIKNAVNALYKDYDAYLAYVEKYYTTKQTLKSCQGYSDFMANCR